MSAAPACAPRALLAVLTIAASSFAQAVPRPADAALLDALDQTAGFEQELVLPAAPDAPFQVELFVDGRMETLVLAPFSLRAPGFQVLVQEADGAIVALPAHEVAPPATVRGFAAGRPRSFFAGSLVAGRLEGVLRLEPRGPLHGVQPASALDPSKPDALHVVYDASFARALPFTCGTEDALAPRGGSAGAHGAAEGGDGSRWTQIACDADTQFYQANQSSVTQTTNDVENVINGVDAIYDADFNLRYLIGTVLVRTAEPDPYSATSASPMLEQFKTEWLVNQSSIHRDVAHLFTGKNISGSTIGVAYLGGVCSLGSGYGLSQSKFSSSMTSRVALTAHELGHNWGANHCNGTSQCWIMCSGLGGCSGGLVHFGPAASAEIQAKLAVATCTSGPPPTAPPDLLAAVPDTVPAIQPGVVTVTGTGMEWVESVTFGGALLSSPEGFVTYGDDVLYLAAATPPALGPVPIVATNAIGSSAPLDLLVTESFPPVLKCDLFGLTSETYVWRIGGAAADLWFLAVSVDDATTFPVLGWPLLIHAQLVGAGTLDAIGTASLGIDIAPSGVGLTFYSQAATVGGGTGALVGATAVQPAFVLL